MLAASGMRAVPFATANEFRRRRGWESVDALLLDWNLPGITGIELLCGLREQPGDYLPVILLTSNSGEREVVFGLQCGADDYIVKPPRTEELVARIRTVYRRARPQAVTTLPDTEPFRFDLRERELYCHGQRVKVTEREFDLLAYLFRRTDRIVSRQMLLAEVWHLGPNVNTRSVDTFISRLRKTLGLCGESGWKLEGIYQHGYRLTRVQTAPDYSDNTAVTSGSES